MFIQSNYVRDFGRVVPAVPDISHAIPSDELRCVKPDRRNSADSNVLWGVCCGGIACGIGEFPIPWLSLLLRGIALLG